MIDGLKFKIGEDAKVIPFMNCKQAKMFAQGGLSALYPEATGEETEMELGLRFVHACTIRNYPEITFEQIEEGIPFGKLNELISALIKASGFTSGEAPANP